MIAGAMNPKTWLVAVILAGVICPAHAQLQFARVSFDARLSFISDFVGSWPPDGSDAHLDLYFPEDLSPGNAYWRMSLRDDEGQLVYDFWRKLDRVRLDPDEEDDTFAVLQIEYYDQGDDPVFLERLDLRLLFETPEPDAKPPFLPFIGIDYEGIPQMYAIGYTPLMGYKPSGYGGYFHLNFVSDFSVTRVPMFDPFNPPLTPVPEPSTYGFAACALLVAFVGFRRWRSGQAQLAA